MKSAIIVPTEDLLQEPYASLLCFPNSSKTELQSRVDELKSHGVSALEFCGKAIVHGVSVPVLGKGFVGLVLIAHLNGRRVAIKIRRTDANRVDLLHEAQLLLKANSVKVGPKLIAASKNFLLMQLIEGALLPEWLEHTSQKVVVKRVLKGILVQCFRLDEVGLDHGELSKAPKHIIIDFQRKPWLLDFETASDIRKTANVSAVGNFLFTSEGEVARTVAAALGERNKNEIVVAMRNYRKERTLVSFERVLKVCLG